jgi:hypothetical protein
LMRSDIDVDFSRGPAAIGKWKGGENLVLPESVFCVERSAQVPVVRIGRGAFSGSPVRKVVIPSSIQVIEEKAFAQALSFETVIFSPNSQLHQIAMHAFYSTAIRTITIPRTVETIGQGCFEGCAKLERITFESGGVLRNIQSRCFAYSTLSVLTIPRTVAAIGPSCFSGCRCLQTLTFEPDSSLETFNRSIIECSGLTTITIPKSVTALGFRAFAGCRSLCDVLFEDGSNLQQIDSHCFSWSALRKICIPKNVTVIGESAFDPCARLCALTFERQSSIAQIQVAAFTSCPFACIHLPRSVEIIGQRCFFGCKALTELMIENGSCLRQIDASGFESSTLSAIIIPGSVESIGRRAFADCRALVNVVFGPGSCIRHIEEESFQACAISMVCLPQSVTSIGIRAFAGCTTLSVLMFEGGSELRSIYAGAFAETALRAVELPAGGTMVDETAFPDGCLVPPIPGTSDAATLDVTRPGMSRLSGILKGASGACRLTQPKLQAKRLALTSLRQIPQETSARLAVVNRREETPSEDPAPAQAFDAPLLFNCEIPTDQYTELAVLGTGSFGKSRQLQHCSSAEKVVAKELKFPGQRLTPQLQEKFYRTIERLIKLRHPCINPLLGSFRVSDSGGTILAPYIEGMSLKTVIDEGPWDWLSPTVITIIVLGVTMAMRFAHENGVFHGALTPSNVIIDSNHRAHVSDFGSLYYQRLGIVSERPTEAQLYHDQGMANDDDDDSLARCDVYSFGIILYEITMIGNGSPAVRRRITLNKLLQGRRPDVPSDVLPFLGNLITACWAEHGVQRPTFNKIYQLMQVHDFRLFEKVDTQAVELFVDSVSGAIVDDFTAT